jgi:hypothetical protein
MVLTFSIVSKKNKSNSTMYKQVNLHESKKTGMSYKSVKTYYNSLLKEGYDKNKIVVQVENCQNWFTIKGLREEIFYDTLEEYYQNKVKNTNKFINGFENVSISIFE